MQNNDSAIAQLTESVQQLNQSVSKQDELFRSKERVYRWVGITLLLVIGVMLYALMSISQQAQAEQAAVKAQQEMLSTLQARHARMSHIMDSWLQEIEQDIDKGVATAEKDLKGVEKAIASDAEKIDKMGVIAMHQLAGFLHEINAALVAVPQMANDMNSMSTNMTTMTQDMQVMTRSVYEMNHKMGIMTYDIDSSMGRAGRMMNDMPFMPWW